MALMRERPTDARHSRTGRRAGYVGAVIVNGIILWVVNNLLDWGWPAFLTDDFERVLPILNVSLIATMVVNFVYLAYDRRWFKSLCQVGLAAISLIVAIRMYRTFPFDFSAYDFDWEALARVVLIIGIVGTAIALVVELFRLGRALMVAGR
jgi:hypothetical protein